MNIQQTLQKAAALFGRGDPAGARQLAEQVLKAAPNNPAALQIAGIAHCQLGAPKLGVPLLRRALKSGGDNPGSRFNLARALVDAGELAEAEALAGAPGQPDAMRRLHADILKALGRPWEAAMAYQQIVDANPQDADSWNNLGNIRHELGELETALAALQQARTLRPDSAIICTNIGRVLASMSRYEDSALAFQEAVRLDPRNAAVLLEFGYALTRLDRSREALVAYADAARIDSTNPEIFVAMGLAFMDLEDRERAEQSYRFALNARPEDGPATLNLGILLEQGNRIAELETLLRQAEARGAKGADIDYLNAMLLRRQGKLEAALALARDARSASINPAVRSHFVGQVADQLGETGLAFAAFEEMHWAMAQSPLGQGVDRRAYQAEVEQLAARTTPEWFARWPTITVPREPASPVFMVGFPRSGTTLLDTILLGHPAVHVLEEVPILAQVADELGSFDRIAEIDEHEAIRLRGCYFDELARVAPDAVGKLIVDKNPLSMMRAPLIHRLFPDARIIFAMRHPCDVVLSCFMQNFKLTQAMASFLDLTSGSLLYDRVMAYWQQCRSILPLNVHEVRYEAMIADVEGTVRPLFDDLGLEWDPSVLDHQRTAKARGFIRTPSYGQVTEPIYTRATGRWERYRPQLAQVLPILEPWVAEFGYGSTASAEQETGS
ncbi:MULTISPECIES: tetratricopeptide repeat-containing sulfotransferase family protein [unclassified Sphingomonas]|uniref:tetratricopeptide repeat-containing sulfotransferase family protein n=1 Tax=unclassified Sphingomonas TaxID=196159 RepID=UPI00082D4EA7|nr:MULTISPECIES: tetratricopeptide repeat-containing sulfotransferase family protein [unclassified Sphingomonas]